MCAPLALATAVSGGKGSDAGGGGGFRHGGVSRRVETDATKAMLTAPSTALRCCCICM